MWIMFGEDKKRDRLCVIGISPGLLNNCITVGFIVCSDDGSPPGGGGSAPGGQRGKLLEGVSAAMVVCNAVDMERAAAWVISVETLAKVLLSQQGETADREHLVRIIMVRRGLRGSAAHVSYSSQYCP